MNHILFCLFILQLFKTRYFCFCKTMINLSIFFLSNTIGRDNNDICICHLILKSLPFLYFSHLL
jgi:hypothetical protein